MENQKILLVDDSIKVIEEVSEMLADGNYSIIPASNGVEGLERLQESKDIALCISDFNMPQMNGLEMVEHMKMRFPDSELKFIMLTTEFSLEHKKKGKTLGINAWMLKPVSKDRLQTLMDKLLPKA